jgi:tRNA dimethylallyltransferase
VIIRLPVIFLMGPTASGKTAFALDVAARFPVHAISVDSALVYRGMDIGTAKPDAATLARVPHALVDIREPEEGYSAAAFRDDALREIAAAHANERIPLLVGGTSLYFRALERGLSDLPDADDDTRARLSAEAAARGWAAMHADLARADAVAASRIHPNDPQRIQRALEVIALSGQPLSAQQGGARGRLPFRILKLAAMPADRAVLHDRIARRLVAMCDAGFLNEVRRLRERPGLHADHPAMRAVGYRQAWQHLEGDGDEPQFLARAIAATRQLAKRQITWLRAETDALFFDPVTPAGLTRGRTLVAEFLEPVTPSSSASANIS